MRAIRNAVDATRRALDDPTGAYRHDEAVVFAANAVEESPDARNFSYGRRG